MSRVGLAVMRMQPLHVGHVSLLTWMAQECEEGYIGIGSCDKELTRSNPLTFDVRKQSIQNVFGKRFKIFPLIDLGATQDANDWVDYVLEKLSKIGLKEPTDYFAGSKADSLWYRNRFYNEELSQLPKPRLYSDYSPTDPYYWNSNDTVAFDRVTGKFQPPERRLHVLDRDTNNYPPATELRSYIELGTDDWKQWVPRVNHSIIETNYPNEFKVGVS